MTTIEDFTTMRPKTIHYVVRRAAVPIYGAWKITDEQDVAKLRGNHPNVRLGWWLVQDVDSNMTLIAPAEFDKTFMTYVKPEPVSDRKKSDLKPWKSNFLALMGVITVATVYHFTIPPHPTAWDAIWTAFVIYISILMAAVVVLVLTFVYFVTSGGAHSDDPSKVNKVAHVIAGVAMGVIQGMTIEVITFK